MKIVKTKEIVPKEVSEITDEKLIDFKDRAKLHNGTIPPFFVYIQDYAWNAFESHSNNIYKESKHESQGIFIGNYYKDNFGEFVVATSYEEGSGNSKSVYVEMSEECLAKISEKCQANGTLMLIWIHTHPGMGVFYSSIDYSCLKTNFYMPYQIGIVADILNKKTKAYKIIKSNDVEEFSDYKLFNDENNILSSPYNEIKIIKESDRILYEIKNEIVKIQNDYNDLKKKLQIISSQGKRPKKIKKRRRLL